MSKAEGAGGVRSAGSETTSTARHDWSWREGLLSAALLMAVVWVARYWHNADFGFYEDDYTLVTRGMAASWPDTWAFSRDLILQFGGQGRPLQHSLLFLLSHLAGRLGGLPETYWLGFIVVAGNSVLAYTVLRRLGGQRFALAGALGAALYPADTTPLFLYHAFGLQQSLTWFWLASHAYLSGHRALAYVLILGSLLSYETIYPVFLAVPLLVYEWDRQLARRMAGHTFILAALFAAVLALRLAVGEARVTELGWPAIVTTLLLHMAQGPLVSMGTYFYRPIQTLLSIDPEILLAILVTTPAFALALLRLPGDAQVSFRSFLGLVRGPAAIRTLPSQAQDMIRLGLSGLVMLLLAYPLTFTIRAYAISGRDTRVHLAAVLGASILWGVFSWFLLAFADWQRRRWLAAWPLAILFGFLVGFGFLVQKDYARAWSLQRAFWADVLRLAPDLEDGTVILVEDDAFDDTRQIAANYWNLPRVLEQVLRFPSSWDVPPRVYRLVPGWEENAVARPGELRIDASTVVAPPSLYSAVSSRLVILLESNAGQLVRRVEPLDIGGADLPLKTPVDVGASFSRGFLYEYLMDGQ